MNLSEPFKLSAVSTLEPRTSCVTSLTFTRCSPAQQGAVSSSPQHSDSSTLSRVDVRLQTFGTSSQGCPQGLPLQKVFMGCSKELACCGGGGALIAPRNTYQAFFSEVSGMFCLVDGPKTQQPLQTCVCIRGLRVVVESTSGWMFPEINRTSHYGDYARS